MLGEAKLSYMCIFRIEITTIYVVLGKVQSSYVNAVPQLGHIRKAGYSQSGYLLGNKIIIFEVITSCKQ